MTYTAPAFTSFVDLLTYANTHTGNLFAYTMLLGMFFIVFTALKNFETKKAFTAAAFGTMVVGILFYFAGVVPEIAIMAMIALTLLGVFLI